MRRRRRDAQLILPGLLREQKARVRRDAPDDVVGVDQLELERQRRRVLEQAGARELAERTVRQAHAVAVARLRDAVVGPAPRQAARQARVGALGLRAPLLLLLSLGAALRQRLALLELLFRVALGRGGLLHTHEQRKRAARQKGRKKGGRSLDRTANGLRCAAKVCADGVRCRRRS